MLACKPTFSGVGGALSRLVLYCQEEDNAEKPLQRFQRRPWHFGASGDRTFLDHIVEKHSGGADEGRALIEYRKKVVGYSNALGTFGSMLGFACQMDTMEIFGVCWCLGLALDAALARGFLREVTSFAAQRRLMENADERLRQPEQGGRFETGCVVCARRFW